MTRSDTGIYCTGTRDAKHIETVLSGEDSPSPRWQQHTENHGIKVTLLMPKRARQERKETSFVVVYRAVVHHCVRIWEWVTNSSEN